MSFSTFSVQLFSGASGFSGVGGSSLNAFVSSDITASGSEQSTPHGLGSIPSIAWAVCVEGHDNAGGNGNLQPVILAGSHDSINCKFTVTSGAKYRAYAIK